MIRKRMMDYADKEGPRSPRRRPILVLMFLFGAAVGGYADNLGHDLARSFHAAPLALTPVCLEHPANRAVHPLAEATDSPDPCDNLPDIIARLSDALAPLKSHSDTLEPRTAERTAPQPRIGPQAEPHDVLNAAITLAQKVAELCE